MLELNYVFKPFEILNCNNCAKRNNEYYYSVDRKAVVFLFAAFRAIPKLLTAKLSAESLTATAILTKI